MEGQPLTKRRKCRPYPKRAHKTRISTWLDLLLDKVIISRIVPHLFLEDLFQLSAACRALRGALFSARDGNQWFAAVGLAERARARTGMEIDGSSGARRVCTYFNKLAQRYYMLCRATTGRVKHNVKCAGWCNRRVMQYDYMGRFRLPMCLTCRKKRYFTESNTFTIANQIISLGVNICAKYAALYPEYAQYIPTHDNIAHIVITEWGREYRYNNILTSNMFIVRFSELIHNYITEAISEKITKELETFKRFYHTYP